MSFKPNNESKKNTSAETIGIILIIVALLILLCLLTNTLILGVIGGAIKYICTAALGYFAYAAFLLMLLIGILIFIKADLKVSKKWVVYISLICFFFLCLMQLITSSELLSLGMGDYIAKLSIFNENKSIGGIFFGIIAFAAKSIMTLWGSYTLFGALTFLFVCLLAIDIYKSTLTQPSNRRDYAKARKNSGKPTTKPSPLNRSGVNIIDIAPVVNSGLYVDTIVPKTSNITSKSGVFSGSDLQTAKEVKRSSILEEIKKEQQKKNEQNSNQKDNQKDNQKGLSSIFEINKEELTAKAIKEFLSSQNTDKEYDNEELQKIVMPRMSTTAPDIKTVEGFSKVGTPLNSVLDIVFPPPKEDETIIYPGEIIDGASFSSQLNKSNITSFKPNDINVNSGSERLVDQNYKFTDEAKKASEFTNNIDNNSYQYGKENFNDNEIIDASTFLSSDKTLTSQPDIKGSDSGEVKTYPGEIEDCSLTPRSPATKFTYDEPVESLPNCYELEPDEGRELKDKPINSIMHINSAMDDKKSSANDNESQNQSNAQRGLKNQSPADGNLAGSDFNEGDLNSNNQNEKSVNLNSGGFTKSISQNDIDEQGLSDTDTKIESEKSINDSFSVNSGERDLNTNGLINQCQNGLDNANQVLNTKHQNIDDINNDQNLEQESQYSGLNKYISPVKEPIYEDVDEDDNDNESYAFNNEHKSNQSQFEDDDSLDEDCFNQQQDDDFDIDFSDKSTVKAKEPDNNFQSTINSTSLALPPRDDYAIGTNQKDTFDGQTVDQQEDSIFSEDSSDDSTGYYIKKPSNSFEKRADSLDKKINPKNQINIDNYLSNVAAKSEEIQNNKPKRKSIKYNSPPLSLLTSQSTMVEQNDEDSLEKGARLEKKLKEFNLHVNVINITKSPAITRYELEMPAGQSVKKIFNHVTDIAYELAAKGQIRIEAPIPGKRAVGVEVPNNEIAIVGLKELLSSNSFVNSTSNLCLSIGKDIDGECVVCPLEKMPHLLVAGATGSGKSICLNSMIISILYKASPSDVRLILIDPKRVEFTLFQNLRHLMINKIIHEKEHAINAFKWLTEEVNRRYEIFESLRIKNLYEYNSHQDVKSGKLEKLPNIVLVVDELCELMQGGYKKEMEDYILRIVSLSRASGVHLILATQRPSTDVITGTIKANLPSRIALAVTNNQDSRVVLDQVGAEMLLGRGDLLYLPADSSRPKRIQGAYISTEEINAVVSYINENNQEDFYDEMEESIINIKNSSQNSSDSSEENTEGLDPLLEDVVKMVIETSQASTSLLQRRFKLGYARAARIMDLMEQFGFIGAMDPSRPTKPREVFITREVFEEFFNKKLSS